jgi:hypothetical protein
MAINCALEESVLLEYDAASLGNRFAMFQDNLVVLSARVKIKWHSSWAFQPLQDDTIILSQNVRYQLCSDAASFSRRTDSSTTLLQTPKKFAIVHRLSGCM